MKKLRRINLNRVMFFDIETVPLWEKWEDCPDNVATEWIYKFKFRDGAPDISDTEAFGNWIANLWIKQAALFPEFSRVVCIVLGYIHKGTLRVKSYSDKNEGKLLTAFSEDLQSFTSHSSDNSDIQLCGHYIKGFDVPFIIKRMIVNRIDIPNALDVYGLKPWETTFLDTQEIWKFGTGASATLPSICMALGLPTSKDDIDGSQVAELFFKGEIDRIVRYCQKDVVSVANIFRIMRSEEPLSELNIEYV